MAGKITIEPAALRRWERKVSKRLVNTRQKRKRYLIVCEGEKTEPHYFESLKATLPRGVLEVVEFRISGKGFNTESLVRDALVLRKQREAESGRAVDKLWVVFDKDSFMPDAFNGAITLCENTPQTEAAWSNEAFELWYLLHFGYYDTSMARDIYKTKIEENFRKNGLSGFVYAKNRSEMYQLLNQYGDQDLALKYSKKLEAGYRGAKNFASQNPCTRVYKLVAELLNLKDMIKEVEESY